MAQASSNKNMAALSGESSATSSSSNNKPHKANDVGWEAIRAVRARDGSVGLSHFKLLQRLGSGDIGSVYLAELRGLKCLFAMKVMDKTALATRNKLLRARTERAILETLDHPFLPTLYAHFETAQFSCLVMEYCPGGDLHSLRQKQLTKCFDDNAVRFYAAEVLLALEYLHMMGVVYRDLKPENVLVREDGHIMLSDFDLSLMCDVSATVVQGQGSSSPAAAKASYSIGGSRRIGMHHHQHQLSSSCILPSCVAPCAVDPIACTPVSMSFPFSSPKKATTSSNGSTKVAPLPELIAEPTGARSMSFVGTHEYLAPEIISGFGHGSAVDWWTFGIFLFELLYGRTPFKGADNESTLMNVLTKPLEFPETVDVGEAAKSLIRGLLAKDPQKRIASARGAPEIKQHPFFVGINWALIRCAIPPEIPKMPRPEMPGNIPTHKKKKSDGGPSFEYF